MMMVWRGIEAEGGLIILGLVVSRRRRRRRRRRKTTMRAWTLTLRRDRDVGCGKWAAVCLAARRGSGGG
jgi:hypothetical protein